MTASPPEPEVHVPTSRPEWIALLSGPSLWFGHFMAVYLLGEVACAAGVLQDRAAGLSWLTWLVLAGTLAALAILGLAAQQTWSYRRRVEGSGQLLGMALALDALFALAIVAVGVPIALLEPC